LTTTSTTRASRSRYRQLTDEQWARIASLLPSNDGKNGRPYADHRRVVEGIIYRYRTGLP
jgi:transposase